MTREEYYKQRSQYRIERSIIMNGWDLKIKAHQDAAIELLSQVNVRYDHVVIESLSKNQQYKMKLSVYRRVAVWSNSRGTRPVNVKKVGRK